MKATQTVTSATWENVNENKLKIQGDFIELQKKYYHTK